MPVECHAEQQSMFDLGLRDSARGQGLMVDGIGCSLAPALDPRVRFKKRMISVLCPGREGGRREESQAHFFPFR